jgi:glycerophosphoryl diester phosphodiesterase
VGDLTKDELIQYNIGENESIPLLYDVLVLAGPNLHVNIEVKEKKTQLAVEIVAGLIKELGVTSFVSISSF